jgi:hypothetical protein
LPYINKRLILFLLINTYKSCCLQIHTPASPDDHHGP